MRIIDLAKHREAKNQARLNDLWNSSEISIRSELTVFHEKVLRDFIVAELRSKSLIDEVNADVTEMHSGYVRTSTPLDGIYTENFYAIAAEIISEVYKPIGFLDSVSVGKFAVILRYYKWRVPGLAP